MSKNKYYAVRTGKIPGIYETWEECKKMIDGYSNAEYKAFGKREDADAFLSNVDKAEKNIGLHYNLETVIAYVDGSFSESAQRYSFGCILLTPAGEIIRKSGFGEDPKALSVRNVAGELQGTMYAVKLACDLGYKKIIVRHDYVGIAKWYEGDWKAKDDIAKIYVDYMRKLSNRIEIVFEKVTAHSGDKYNEEADKLAKKALENSPQIRKDDDISATLENSRHNLIKLIKETTMDTNEVIDYLGISKQKLNALIKKQILCEIKTGIYLKTDIEKVKYDLIS